MYHHYDARGRCILLTDPNVDLIEQYDYDAFGQPYFFTGWGEVLNDSAQGNRFLFTGREWLKELRGYHYRNRLYMPQLGRFLQPDPQTIPRWRLQCLSLLPQ
jgi:RHS repeat-associated protein